MGVSSSKLTVKAKLRCVGDWGVDTLEVSRLTSGGCCGRRRRRTLASFTFRRGGEEENELLVAERAASLKVGRLAAKDQDSPIMVKCLEGGKTVVCQEFTLADLLSCLRYTTAGRDAVLLFCLAGTPGVHGGEGEGQSCPVLFCNGKRLGRRKEEPRKDDGASVPKEGEEADPPNTEQEREGSRDQEGGPTSKDGKEVVATTGEEANHGQEVGQEVVASPGQDGLGLCVSVPSPEEEREEAGGDVSTPVEDEGAGVVLRRVGKELGEPSPPPQRGSGKAGRGRKWHGVRLYLVLWGSLLPTAQSLTHITLAFFALLEYFPG